jgi:hypothetical protein
MMANRNILRLALTGSLAALLISAPAHSQSAGKMMKGGDSAGVSRTFSLLDTDGDGKISLAEIRAEQARLIAGEIPVSDLALGDEATISREPFSMAGMPLE